MKVKSLKDIVQKPITGEWGTEGNKVKVLRTTNFTNESKVDFSNVVLRNIDKKKINAKKLHKGDIIIEKSGGSPKQPVGRVVYFNHDEEFLCNNFTAILRPKPELVFPKYLLYILFANHKFGFTSAYQNKTTGIINLQLPRYLKGTKIPLPQLPEQKRIAAILDKADEVRQLNKKIIEKYDKLAQSLFLDMFGDPVTNPMCWIFSDIGSILSSKTQNGHYAPKEDYLNIGGVQMVHMSDAFYNKVTPGNLKRIKFSDKIVSKYILKSEDILLSRRSLNYEGSAKPCLIPDYHEPLIYESSLIRISPNLNKINTTFLYYYLSDSRARTKYVFKHVTKSTISGINNKGLNAIEIYVPPIALQNQFAERIAETEKQKTLAEKSLAKSEDLFNALLQKSFKGGLVKTTTD